jgi:hypothetical protein
VSHTEFEVLRVRNKLKLFVQSDAFARASNILDTDRVVVISGPPGIGKTTLAEMLLYAHLGDGYEPVAIQSDIAEGRKFFRANARTLFYFDDFLGQVFLGDRADYLSRNQDVALVNFIQMVRQSSAARFILTTREHLLSSALQASERLSQSSLLDHRCVLQLRDYSRSHRARILYNHLYFSDLPLAFKSAILEDGFFLKIVDHAHFNPRLIEWLSSYSRLRGVVRSGYQGHIATLLESPETLWGHAYRSQISDAARNVLIALNTLGGWATEIVDLEPVFSALHRLASLQFHRGRVPGDFRRALRELDGAFLSYGPGGASFLNPSVSELVSSVLSSDAETARVIVESAVRFKQVINLQQLADSRPDSELARMLASDHPLMHRALARLSSGPSTRWESGPSGYRGYPVDAGEEARLMFLIEMAERHRSVHLCALAKRTAHDLVETWERHVPAFMSVVRLLGQMRDKAWFLENSGRTLHQQMLDGMLDHLIFASADDWVALLALPQAALDWGPSRDERLASSFSKYQEDGAADERRDCTTLDELEALHQSLIELQRRYGANLARHIERVGEDMADRQEESESEESDLIADTAHLPVTPTIPRTDRPMTDDDVRELFRTLVEER